MNNALQEILLVPPPHLMKDRIFELEGELRSYEVAKPMQVLRYKLKRKGFDLKTIDMSKEPKNAIAVVFSDLPKKNDTYYQFCIKNKLQDKMYLIIGEPPATRPDCYDQKLHGEFKGVSTFSTELIDNKKYFYYNYVLPIQYGEKVMIPRNKFESQKLLCNISGNKFSSHSNELYGERVKAIDFMEKYHPEDFDLYGTGWEKPMIHARWASALKINGMIWRFWPKNIKIKQFKTHKGPHSKKGLLQKYKFTIAYENCITNGYISEKILEAMLYGTVPIYSGDPNIEKRIPKDCFIDKRDFKNYESLYRFISSMDKKTHDGYLDRIEKFLNSKKAYPFTINAFVDNFENMLSIERY
ncbi:MAG: glycosyltransferase family 10 [Candidatus Micrarchaeota archaeon]